MSRESSKGTKKLMSVFVNKEIVALVEIEAAKNRRTKSAQVEYMLAQTMEKTATEEK
jgi:hypothetical protein